MHFKKLFVISLLGLLTLAFVPATAAAQGWFVTPFIGGNFGRDANFNQLDADIDEDFSRRLDFGAAAGWNPGIVGFEVDFGFSPKFFENSIGFLGFENNDSNLTTLMGNVLVSMPPGTVLRPYMSAGFGWIRSHVGTELVDFTANDWGVDVGGGVNGHFTDSLALRGDLRYFRSLEANEPIAGDLIISKFNFWRGTIGVTFGW
jgi:opacity protein-like surface antigen